MNAVVVNFSGGETSPRSRGRFDQPWYLTSARKMLNVIPDLQGPMRMRPGFVFSRQTRQGQVARIVNFQISDALSYELELTPGYLRVYNPLTQDLQLSGVAPSITGISNAAQAVFTVSSAAGLANGQEVILSGIVGIPELNNRQLVIANLSGNTFKLQDSVTGAYVSTSALGAYTSGGVAAVIYETTTPWSALDLEVLQTAAADGVMYATCPRRAPQKVTVDAYGNFSVSSYVRTNDPFALAALAASVTGVAPLWSRDDRFQNGTITPAAVSGTNIGFSSSQPIFSSSDVGKYIEKVPMGASDTGYGRALITTFVDTQHVTCTILTAFDATTPISAGDWFITTVLTLVTLASNSVVNASLTYSFSGVGGATQINGNSYQLVPFDVPGTTSSPRFVLRTTQNIDVDSSSWGIYTSGGTATPTSAQPTLTLTGVTRGTKTIVTFAAGSVINPNAGYTFSSVGGTTQLNGQTYWLKTESDGVHLTAADGSEVDSSGWSAYTSGGIASASAENPIAVAFYEGRLVFAGTNQRPDCLFLSRSPNSSGNSRYDDFTGGTNADFACFFQLAPTGGSTSFISWARGGPDYLFVGTFGGPYRVSGSGLDIPITPSSINVRQFDTAGCEETQPAGLQQMFFIQRGGSTLRSIKVINPYLATFESADMGLNAEQVGYSPLQRVVLQRGRPDCLWAFRADGTLVGMAVHLTVQNADTLTGWHRHAIGGEGSVQDISAVPRQTGYDQLWAVVQRTVNGAARCYVEVMADDVVFPDPEDFFTGDEDADELAWQNAVWRKQEEYVHLDAEAEYDGSARGVAAGATLTPSAVGAPQVEGQAAVPITLTASQNVFSSSDVGSEIWVKPDAVTGQGAGRAYITAVTDAQHATATPLVPFSSTSPVLAGDWYFAVSTFYGFGHLEGQTVAVVGDGAVISEAGQSGESGYPTLTVTNGKLSLPAGDLNQQPRAALLRVGLPYVGMGVTHNLEMGGRSGPAQSKPRDIKQIYVRFMNSLGCEYGTDLYATSRIDHRLSGAIADRPPPVFSGIKRLVLEDSWSGLEDYAREKNVVFVQRLPLPMVVEYLDLYFDTDDAGAEA